MAIPCTNCGSEQQSWDVILSATSGVAMNRLSLHDVTAWAVLGCDECSETLMTVPAVDAVREAQRT